MSLNYVIAFWRTTAQQAPCLSSHRVYWRPPAYYPARLLFNFCAYQHIIMYGTTYPLLRTMRVKKHLYRLHFTALRLTHKIYIYLSLSLTLTSKWENNNNNIG